VQYPIQNHSDNTPHMPSSSKAWILSKMICYIGHGLFAYTLPDRVQSTFQHAHGSAVLRLRNRISCLGPLRPPPKQ
jgi:hypothetical protein